MLVVQREGGALNFMNASSAYGQFGTGNGYPVRILVNSAWRMSLNLDNSLTMLNGASCTAGGVWTNASSRELKENVEDLGVAEAQEALRELAPVKYNYTADKEEKHVGFIAEDVPDLVASNAESQRIEDKIRWKADFFIIFCISMNWRRSWFTSLTGRPLPRAMRRRRLPLIRRGLARSSGVMESMIAS